MAAPANHHASASAASSSAAATSSRRPAAAADADESVTCLAAQLERTSIRTSAAAAAAASDSPPNQWETPAELRWRDEWDSDGTGDVSYFPSEVFRSPKHEGLSINIHGVTMRVSKQIHEILELLMRRRTPLPLHPVALTAPRMGIGGDGGSGVEGLFTFRSTHGSEAGWPVKVDLSDRQPPADDASASGVLPWIWHKGEWHWLLQVSKSKPQSAMNGQPKIDPMRGKPILGINDDAISPGDVAVRAAWAESCRVLLFSPEDVAGAIDLDHEDQSLNTSNLFHVRLTAGADGSAQDMSTWLGDDRTEGSFRHAFAHNQRLLRTEAEERVEMLSGTSAEEMMRKINKIEDLWICPVHQLMQTMIAMANDYIGNPDQPGHRRIVHRPPSGLGTVPNQAYVRYLPPSWVGDTGRRELKKLLKDEAGCTVSKIVLLEPRGGAQFLRPRPFAYVTFASKNDRDAALQLNGTLLPGLHPPSFLDIVANQNPKERKKIDRESHGHKHGEADDAIQRDKNPHTWN
jgi:hypothetical protein